MRSSIQGGRWNASNTHFKSEISYEVFNINSKELNVNSNLCEILEKCFNFLNEYEKQNAEELDSKYDE